MKPPFAALAHLAWSQFWQVTVVALLVGVLVRLFCRKRPHLAYLLWLLVILKCLTPPVLSSPTGVFSWVQARVTTPLPRDAPQDAVVSTPLPADIAVSRGPPHFPGPPPFPGPEPPAPEAFTERKTATVNAPPPEAPERRVQAAEVLGVIWLCGAVVYAGIVIGLRLRWSQLLRHSSAAAHGALASLVPELSKRLGVTRKVRLLVISRPLGPVAYGVLRPTVLLPALLLNEKSPRQIDAVLAHELVHVRRRDNLMGMLQLLAQAIWWFHPLVWWANRQTCRERERCCDEEVVARPGCEPGQYAQSLLDVLKLKHKLRPVFAFPGVRPGEITSKRIEEIMEPTRRFHRRTPRWCCPLILAAAVLIIPGRGWVIGRAAEPPKPDEPIGGGAEPAKPDHKEVASATTKPARMTLRRVAPLGSWLHPTVSPDGRYVCDQGGQGQLVVRELATGKERVLVPQAGGKGARAFAVSPDSKRVAYMWHNLKNNSNELQVIGLDGSGRRVLRTGESIAPKDWSPDGKQLLALRADKKEKKMQLVFVSTEDGSVRPLTTAMRTGWLNTVDLSPDGRYIAYNRLQEEGSHKAESLRRRYDIVISAIDENQETVLKHPADDRLFGWTPDGKRIFFKSDRTDAASLYLLRVADGKPQGSPEVVNATIGEVKRIGFAQSGAFYYGHCLHTGNVYTATVDLKAGKALSSPEPVQHGLWGCPAWSPDGKYLAYSPIRFPKKGPTTIRIRSLASGEERVLLTSLPFVMVIVWGPDGRSLLATGYAGKFPADTKEWAHGVYRIDVETGEPNLLHKSDAGFLWRAELSPDGKSLVYSVSEAGTSNDGLFVRDLETGREKRICESVRGTHIFGGCWDLSPDGKRVVIAGAGHDKLKIISVEGAELRQLVPEKWEGGPDQVAWAPDGQSVLFSVQRDYFHGELWQISAEGGEPRKLFSTGKLGFWRPSLCVHPDGRRIAFTASRGEAAAVWVMENFLPAE